MSSGEGCGEDIVFIDGIGVPADHPIAKLDRAITALQETSLTPDDPQSASNLLRVLEHSNRRLFGCTVEAMDQIDRRNLHREDGHGSVAIQARHAAKLSGATAQGRSKTMHMLRALPIIKDALWAGTLPIDHCLLLARVYSNPRVQGAMEGRQERFLEQVAKFDFPMFEVRVREWERLVDEDGPEPAGARSHRNRDTKLVQDPIELGWELRGGFGPLDGARNAEILDIYCEAELLEDWEKARAEHGDNATAAHLPRTSAQRRADAMTRIFEEAANNDTGPVPADFTHDIVWSPDTYEEMLSRADGNTPNPLDPDTYRCETLDGVPLEPTEAFANSLVSTFRRVIVSTKGVTLEMGTKRGFTGPLRDAIRIQTDGGRCVWPGCHHRASRCETDHLRQHTDGGLTNPGNGAPLCGKHNRWKQKGFVIRRDPIGTFHVLRPAGTEI